ncbi:hypothetical protein [Streptomyces sp. MNP-20]|uniref:hypothetical protein n=1 Tax=Streptomyces sp. MNP-20 TaxID=2721165 RepID=UPI001553F5D9|nr:hypothetical protein [Streptomyces sp. MNP-20]
MQHEHSQAAYEPRIGSAPGSGMLDVEAAGEADVQDQVVVGMTSSMLELIAHQTPRALVEQPHRELGLLLHQRSGVLVEDPVKELGNILGELRRPQRRPGSVDELGRNRPSGFNRQLR